MPFGLPCGLVLDGTTLWVAAALLYLQNSVRPVAGPAIVLTATGEHVAAHVTRGAVGIGRRRFDVPRPLAGLEVAFVLPIDTEPAATAPGGPGALLKALRPLRVLATLGFVMMFVVVPLLAGWLGLRAALLWGLPAVYALNLAQAVVLGRRRAAFGLDSRQCWQLIADIMLCAPYGPALPGRIAARARFDGDPLSMVQALAPDDIVARVAEPLRDDPSLSPAWQARIARLPEGGPEDA